MSVNMLSFGPAYLLILQIIFNLEYGLCKMPHKINPYAEVFKMQLKEPPVNKNINNRDRYAVKEQWLEQPLDHFDATSEETWMMRYLVNDNYFWPGAPIFVFVGGEWEISPQMLQNGHFHDMARQQKAVMFYTEHRFYGQSWPKSNTSSNNLIFLNVLQSLEDLKNFLIYKKSSIETLRDSKVVLVGGSYSGSMVTWFMHLYPDLASAAWASSAPLVAKMDFKEYMTLTMASIYKKGGFTCGLKLEKAFSGLRERLETDFANGLQQRLKMCKAFQSTNLLHRQAFFNGLGNHFASLVQSYSSLIPQFCVRFNNLDLDATEALIKYLIELFSSSADVKTLVREDEEYCLDFSYEGMKSIFADESDLKTGTRPWLYQTCHEFGWFTTTTTTSSTTFDIFSPPLPFGGLVPLSYFQQMCQDVFSNSSSIENLGHGREPPLTSQQLHDRVLEINKLFGGFSNVSKRVIFTHGLLDPWRAVGLQNGQNVLLIKDYSHVEDLGSIDFSDTVEMNVAKLKVAAFINRNLRKQ